MVGYAEDDELNELRTLSDALAEEGVTWSEPATTDESFSAGFPYSWLHHLRRVLALVDRDLPVTPVDETHPVEADREVVEEVSEMFSSHLLCHADDHGFYVPVYFDEPLFLPQESGGMVGSTQGLLTELRRCAPALGITLSPDGSLPEAETERLHDLPGDDNFRVESTVWLAMHGACQASLRSGCAIVFC
ncbi:hypothetical protein GCM10009682_58900 [Luedemannella flava]|uniref:Uncharacterized protein n=1 Tax=Luedemannella flava TaxID=349316 RepID=A0ABP4YW02_9ACTN